MKELKDREESEIKELLKSLKTYMKKHKILVKDIAEETGYTPVHMSLVLSGKKRASERCLRDIIASLARYAMKNYKEFQELLRSGSWEMLFLSLYK